MDLNSSVIDGDYKFYRIQLTENIDDAFLWYMDRKNKFLYSFNRRNGFLHSGWNAASKEFCFYHS